MSEIWNKVYSSDTSFFGGDPSNFAFACYEEFKKNNVKKILELGCGQGRDTVFFASNGIDVSAIDSSQVAIDTLSNITNGVKNLISYSPVKALSNAWVVLSVQPYDDAFAPIVSAQNQMILMVALIVSVAVVFGVLLQRTFGSLERTTVTLKHSNEQLIGKENELQEANKVLLQTERQKEEFISMISHELRTPLVPIKGYAEMLLKGIMGELNTNQLKAILSIVRNVEKQEALVEDVLDVYKLDMGKINLLKKAIPIKDVVTDITNDLNSLTKEKQVQLLSQISDPDPMIVADRRRLEQVIANLIKNSIDFVPKETGKIVLRIEEQTAKDPGTETATTVYVFSVEDNGIGIPVDKMDSLFNKFYQVDTTAKRKHGGTGLGLAISRGLVEAHGGIIWIPLLQRIQARLMPMIIW